MRIGVKSTRFINSSATIATLPTPSRLTGSGGNLIQKRWQDFVIKSYHQ